MFTSSVYLISGTTRAGNTFTDGVHAGAGGSMKHDDNPMHPAQRLFLAPRCKAMAKRTGAVCKAPAVKGWSVCRMHGANGGAPFGPGNGMWKHGGRAKDVTETRRLIATLNRMAREETNRLA